MSDQVIASNLSPRALLEAERIESEAWADLLRAAPPPLADRLGISVVRDGGLLTLRSAGIDHLLFNRVLGVGPETTLTRARIDRLIEDFRTHGVPRYFVQLNRHLLREPVPTWLGEAGLARYPRAWVKLGRALHSVAPAKSAFEIVRTTHGNAQASAAILTGGFDLPEQASALFRALVDRPRWHLYSALEGGHTVAAAGLFVDGSTAYLAFSSTLPAYRGRGAQSALLERRLRVALALGATFVASDTGEPVAGDPQHSYGNLGRAGLMPLDVRQNWALPGTRW